MVTFCCRTQRSSKLELELSLALRTTENVWHWTLARRDETGAIAPRPNVDTVGVVGGKNECHIRQGDSRKFDGDHPAVLRRMTDFTYEDLSSQSVLYCDRQLGTVERKQNKRIAQANCFSTSGQNTMEGTLTWKILIRILPFALWNEDRARTVAGRSWAVLNEEHVEEIGGGRIHVHSPSVSKSSVKFFSQILLAQVLFKLTRTAQSAAQTVTDEQTRLHVMRAIGKVRLVTSHLIVHCSFWKFPGVRQFSQNLGIFFSEFIWNVSVLLGRIQLLPSYWAGSSLVTTIRILHRHSETCNASTHI